LLTFVYVAPVRQMSRIHVQSPSVLLEKRREKFVIVYVYGNLRGWVTAGAVRIVLDIISFRLLFYCYYYYMLGCCCCT